MPPSPRSAPGASPLEVAEHSGLGGAPVLIGTMAGLFASILLSMLMITYHTNPGEAPKLAALSRQQDGEGGSTLSPACSISARSSDTSLLAVVSSLSP